MKQTRNVQTVKEHSAILEDGIQKGTLQKCPHCGCHFIVAAHGTLAEAKQSAISDLAFPRIFCTKCGRLTCGRPCCDPNIFGCIPQEARLDHIEGKKTTYDDLIDNLHEKGGSLHP